MVYDQLPSRQKLMIDDPYRTSIKNNSQTTHKLLLTEKLPIEVDSLGYLVGSKGARIKLIRSKTGANVRYVEEPSNSKCFYAIIQGTTEQLEAAKAAICADLLEYHRWAKRNRRTSLEFFEARLYPHSLVLRLPPGGFRFFTGPGFQLLLDLLHDKDVPFSFEHQDHIIVKAKTSESLTEAVDKIKALLSSFISIAIPIPNWLVGRVLGRKGEVLTKISELAQMKTGSPLVCFILNTDRNAGLASHLVILSTGQRAISMAMHKVISRVVMVTVDAGLLLPILGSENVHSSPCGGKAPIYRIKRTSDLHMRTDSSTSVAGSPLLNTHADRVSPVHARHFSTIENSAASYQSIPESSIMHRRLNSFAPDQVEAMLHSDTQPQVLLRLACWNGQMNKVQPPVSYCSFCCDKYKKLLPLNSFLNTPYVPESAQVPTVAVDKRYIVMHVPEEQHALPEFWQASLLAALAAVGRDFFFIKDSNTAIDLLIQAFDFTVSCYPGRIYYLSQSDAPISTIYEVSEGLNNRRFVIWFDIGVDAHDYTEVFKDSQTHYFWHAKQLVNANISDPLPDNLKAFLPVETQASSTHNSYSMWHSLALDRYVKPSGYKASLEEDFMLNIAEEDISQLQDTDYEPILNVSGLSISYIIQRSNGYDILIRIGLVPKSLAPLLSISDNENAELASQKNARLLLIHKYIKRFKERPSSMAFISPITGGRKQEIKLKSMQFGEVASHIQYHVASLNLPEISADEALSIDPSPLSIDEMATNMGYSTTAGLLPALSGSKFPLSSTILIQDQSSAVLNRMVFRVIDDIVVSSIYTQEFPHTFASRPQIEFRMRGNSRWDNKGFSAKTTSFNVLKDSLPGFVTKVINTLESFPDRISTAL